MNEGTDMDVSACAWPKTSATLVGRLKDPSDAAWAVFLKDYGGPIYRFAERMGCNKSQAEDIVQDTILALMGRLPKFDYDPEKGRFRGYLRTTVRGKCLDLLGKRGRKNEISIDEVVSEGGSSLLDELADASTPSPDEQLERKWRKSLFDEALQCALNSLGCNARDADLFKECMLEEVDAATLVARHGIKRNNAYMIKHRAEKKLEALKAKCREHFKYLLENDF